MARRKFVDKLIPKENILENLKKIPNTKSDYISPNGNVYKEMEDGLFYKKSIFTNKHNGYKYVSLQREDGTQYQRRLHILMAEAYIPNDNNLPIVMHKNNIKSDCSLENLKWGTVKENTQNAFNDGLIENDIGFEDSQSIEIISFDMNKNILHIYGSIREASRSTGIAPAGIIYQCDHKVKSKPRCGIYFRYLEEYDWYGFVL